MLKTSAPDITKVNVKENFNPDFLSSLSLFLNANLKYDFIKTN